MFRKSVFILALLCFLAISNSAIATQLNWAGTDANWFKPANWGGTAPTGGDWAAIQPGYTQPIIDGDAACSPLDIEPWSGGGLSSVDMNSGTLDFGSALNCATWGTFDTSAPGFSPGVLYVHGGTVTTQSEGSAGLVIGSSSGPSVGRVIMYGGLISVPKVALYNGDIALYGGTLETWGDGNFVFSTDYPENKIDISGGTLKLTGSDPTIDVITLTNLITAGHIYSSRGTIGSPVFDVNHTSITSTDVNMIRAWNPSPANGATNIHYKDTNSITLSWNKGDYDANVIDQYVYFGTSSGTLVFKGTRHDATNDPCNWTIPGPFAVGGNYYWRIDEINTVSSACATGKVWRFKVHDGKAYNPKPVDDANVGKALDASLRLTWTAGDWAQSTGGHKVFFGTNYTTVSQGDDTDADGGYRGTVSDPYYPLSRLAEKGPNPPGKAWTLVAGKNYYWRVDEVNAIFGAVKVGNVWSFTPAAYLNIDDFEDSMSTDDVNANWPNGYLLTTTDTDQTGMCNSRTARGYAGRLLVRDSTGKYLQYTYNMFGTHPEFYGMVFSEARHTYDATTGTSFLGAGVINPAPRALRIDYKGRATNAANVLSPGGCMFPIPNQTDAGDLDRMYVAIEDTAHNVAIYLNPDANAQLSGNWASWYSALTDMNDANHAEDSHGNATTVNLNAITGFAIGFGIRGDAYAADNDGQDVNSVVLFDNIRLYAAACVSQYAPTADLDGDCDVDINDMDSFANDWLKHADNPTFGATPPHKAPVLWYKFEETGTTSQVQDSGTGDANNYVGTISNWNSLNWKIGGGRDGNNCLYLPSGRNSYLNVPVSATYSPPNSYGNALGFMDDVNHATADGGGITFSTWINADLTAFGGWIYGFIVVKDVNGNDATEIACPHHYSPSDWSANGAWAGWAKNGNPNFSLGPSTVMANYGGRWNHWAFVKAPHTLSWYCNGTLLRQEADTDANAGDPNISGPLFHLPVSAFTIGLGGWGGNWAGYIDDFQVYDYALSAEEVAYITTNGTGHVVLRLTSPANFNYDGGLPTDVNQIVNFGDLAIMEKQWHTQILWP